MQHRSWLPLLAVALAGTAAPVTPAAEMSDSPRAVHRARLSVGGFAPDGTEIYRSADLVAAAEAVPLAGLVAVVRR